MKKCPYCAEEIQDEAIKCKHCKSDLPVPGGLQFRNPATSPAPVSTPPPAPAPQSEPAVHIERPADQAPEWPHTLGPQLVAVVVGCLFILTLGLFLIGLIPAVMIAITAALIFADAWVSRIGKDKSKRSVANMSPAGWAIATLGLFIIAIPLYIANRRRLRRRQVSNAPFVVAVVFAGLSLAASFLPIVGGFAFGRLKKAQVTNAKQVIHNLENALVHYAMDNKDPCPADLKTLYTQKYIDRVPTDPWGQDFIFKCPGEHDQDSADISSKGPDGIAGTADDINSWEL